MDIRQSLLTTSKILKDHGIDHALIGGLALGAHGIQRFTNDVDFLVDEADRLSVRTAFTQRGYSIFFESQDVIQFEGPCNVDFLLAQRPISRKLLQSAQELGDFSIKCVSVEGIIGLKIQAYVNAPKRALQDKADIQALMERHKNLKWDEVKAYADIFGQWQEIENIRALMNAGGAHES